MRLTRFVLGVFLLASASVCLAQPRPSAAKLDGMYVVPGMAGISFRFSKDSQMDDVYGVSVTWNPFEVTGGKQDLFGRTPPNEILTETELALVKWHYLHRTKEFTDERDERSPLSVYNSSPLKYQFLSFFSPRLSNGVEGGAEGDMTIFSGPLRFFYVDNPVEVADQHYEVGFYFETQNEGTHRMEKVEDKAPVPQVVNPFLDFSGYFRQVKDSTDSPSPSDYSPYLSHFIVSQGQLLLERTPLPQQQDKASERFETVKLQPGEANTRFGSGLLGILDCALTADSPSQQIVYLDVKGERQGRHLLPGMYEIVNSKDPSTGYKKQVSFRRLESASETEARRLLGSALKEPASPYAVFDGYFTYKPDMPGFSSLQPNLYILLRFSAGQDGILVKHLYAPHMPSKTTEDIPTKRVSASEANRLAGSEVCGDHDVVLLETKESGISLYIFVAGVDKLSSGLYEIQLSNVSGSQKPRIISKTKLLAVSEVKALQLIGGK